MRTFASTSAVPTPEGNGIDDTDVPCSLFGGREKFDAIVTFDFSGTHEA
jgi:hypothetical protein